MSLSKSERLILSNQYKILEKLDPHNKGEYELNREIVENGFAFNYEEILQYMYDELSVRDCKRVLDILAMYTDLYQAFTKLKLPKIIFYGFDGNNETALMSYTQFYINKLNRFSDIPKISSSPDFDSHMPTEAMYNRMLEAWNESKDKVNLTKEDVQRIIESQKAP